MSECCAWADGSEFVPLDNFVPDVQANIPTVAAELAANAVRLAAIELCQRVPFVTRGVVLDLQANVPDYVLDLPDNYRASGLLSVTVRGRVTPIVPFGNAYGRGLSYLHSERLLMFRPPPSSDGVNCLHARVSVFPGQLSCHLPREVFDDALEVVVDGALARLLLIPKATWNDKSTAGVYQKKFSAGLSRMSNAALRGGITGPMMMRARRFV